MTKLGVASVLLAGALAACAPSPDEAAGMDDFHATTLAVVPECTAFDLKRLIAQTHDSSPPYQCRVSPGLSRSSQPDERWIKSLSDPAIRNPTFRAVVNLRGESGANGEAPIVTKYGMKALQIPVTDLRAPTRAQVIQFLKFVTEAPATHPVLAHCKAGQGRTGTFVAAYRMAVQGWTPDAAITEARAFNVNDAQVAFLRDLARDLNTPDLKQFLGAPGAGP